MGKFCGICWILVILASCSADDQPPFGRDLTLRFAGNEFAVGYTLREQIESRLGKPDKIEFSERGGEEFYWTKISTLYYFKGKLQLSFSASTSRLIQLIFSPDESDVFEGFLGVSEKSVKNEIAGLAKGKGIDFFERDDLVLWTSYQSRSPVFTASAGLNFTSTGHVAALNYTIDGPWFAVSKK